MWTSAFIEWNGWPHVGITGFSLGAMMRISCQEIGKEAVMGAEVMGGEVKEVRCGTEK